jgi:hypothetical protein
MERMTLQSESNMKPVRAPQQPQVLGPAPSVALNPGPGTLPTIVPSSGFFPPNPCFLVQDPVSGMFIPVNAVVGPSEFIPESSDPSLKATEIDARLDALLAPKPQPQQPVELTPPQPVFNPNPNPNPIPIPPEAKSTAVSQPPKSRKRRLEIEGEVSVPRNRLTSAAFHTFYGIGRSKYGKKHRNVRDLGRNYGIYFCSMKSLIN